MRDISVPTDCKPYDVKHCEIINNSIINFTKMGAMYNADINILHGRKLVLQFIAKKYSACTKAT